MHERWQNHARHLAALLEQEHREDCARHRQRTQELTLKQRGRLGWALPQARVVDEALGLGNRWMVTLETTFTISDLFRPGQVVEVAAHRAEHSNSVRGIVYRRGPRGLVVVVETSLDAEGPVRVELGPNDVTYRRAQAGLEAVTRAPGMNRRLDNLLKPNPRFTETPVIWDSEHPFNSEQQIAVERGLSAEDFFLIHGPPGTGKTTVLIEIMRRAVASDQRVLMVAPSNTAVDHLLDRCLRIGLVATRLGHPARAETHLVDHCLDHQVQGHSHFQIARDLRKQARQLFSHADRARRQSRRHDGLQAARTHRQGAKQLLREARTHEETALRAVLRKAEVVCGTCATVAGTDLGSIRFGRVVFDEATQAIEPLALWAFAFHAPVVLGGDHCQLPPTVLSSTAARGGLAVSVFERLMRLQSTAPTRYTQMLRQQYRMNQSIMTLVSELMYEGQLTAPSKIAHQRLDFLVPEQAQAWFAPLIFLDTAGAGLEESRDSDSDSYFNTGEIELVVQHTQRLLAAGLAPSDLAIIAPYRAQTWRLRSALENVGAANIEVSTVDAFQGREKSAVLISLTRSNATSEVGFLREIRRINVAVSRAQRHLLMVGDSATLSALPFFEQVVDFCQRNDSYHSVWSWPQTSTL